MVHLSFYIPILLITTFSNGSTSRAALPGIHPATSHYSAPLQTDITRISTSDIYVSQNHPLQVPWFDPPSTSHLTFGPAPCRCHCRCAFPNLLDGRWLRCYVRPRPLDASGVCRWGLSVEIETQNATIQARTSRSAQIVILTAMLYALLASQASFILIQPFTRRPLLSVAVTTSFLPGSRSEYRCQNMAV